MNTKNKIALGFLIVLWWVGVWGIIETLVQHVVKGSVKKALFIYGMIVAFVIIIINHNPGLLEHFT
jgi:hypothetical protein